MREGPSMQRANQFLERFLQEQAELQETWYRQGVPFYEKYFGEAWLEQQRRFLTHERQNPETLVNVEESGDSATAITTHTTGTLKRRTRYHLARSRDGWKIETMDFSCLVCDGTGKFGGKVCDSCSGDGWSRSDPTPGGYQAKTLAAARFRSQLPKNAPPGFCRLQLN